MAKYLTLVLIILFSANANAQSNQKDSIATDQTPLFSIREISVVDSILQKKINRFELQDYNEIYRYLQGLANSRVAAYNAARQQQPPSKK